MHNIELREGEKIIYQPKGDCWRTPDFFLLRQQTGQYFFTNQRIIFKEYSIIKAIDIRFEIEYKDIIGVKKCLVPPCFPFGIKIWLSDKEVYILSLWGRKKYIEFISSYIGNAKEIKM